MNNNKTNNNVNKTFIQNTLLKNLWNFKKKKILSFYFKIINIITKLYKNNIKKKNKIKKYLKFLNINLYMIFLILEILIAIKKKKINGININKNIINNIKINLIKPLSGISDIIFWIIIRPILTILESNIYKIKNIINLLLFFIFFNIIRLLILYYSIYYGYKNELKITKYINNNIIKKIIEILFILELFIIGGLINKWTNINIPLIILNQQKKKITLKTILNKILPNNINLIIILIYIWLLKKKINLSILMIFTFTLNIIGKYFNII